MTDILLFLMAIPVIALTWFGVGVCMYALWRELIKK